MYGLQSQISARSESNCQNTKPNQRAWTTLQQAAQKPHLLMVSCGSSLRIPSQAVSVIPKRINQFWSTAQSCKHFQRDIIAESQTKPTNTNWSLHVITKQLEYQYWAILLDLITSSTYLVSYFMLRSFPPNSLFLFTGLMQLNKSTVYVSVLKDQSRIAHLICPD